MPFTEGLGGSKEPLSPSERVLKAIARSCPAPGLCVVYGPPASLGMGSSHELLQPKQSLVEPAPGHFQSCELNKPLFKMDEHNSPEATEPLSQMPWTVCVSDL